MINNRTAYLERLYELVGKNPDIVVLDVDNMKASGKNDICSDYPRQFVQCGIAEQNMIGIAAGLAFQGKISFATTFSVFASMRAAEQIRNTVCYAQANVKVVGTHSGLETGFDGGTHQGTEDIAIMRSLAHMRVVTPASPNAARALTDVLAENKGPFYMRMGKAPAPELYDGIEAFPLGGSKTLHEGKDLTIMAIGCMVWRALEAAKLLEKEGIHVRVVDMYSIKPIDEAAIVKAISETGGILTAEDHNIHGGFGSAVAEVVCSCCPGKVKRMGLNDVFGRSGDPDRLYEMYHLAVEDIIEACRKF